MKRTTFKKLPTSHTFTAVVYDGDLTYLSESYPKFWQAKYAKMSMLLELKLLYQFKIITTHKSISLWMDDIKLREWIPAKSSDITIDNINMMYDYWIDNLYKWNETTPYKYSLTGNTK